jgi:hypothetical protein
MTKFASREDVGYRRITGELKRWVKVAGTAVKVPVLSTDQEGQLPERYSVLNSQV